VRDFHGAAFADAAAEHFTRVFQSREEPEQIEEMVLAAGTHSLVDVLVAAAMAPSKSEARRLLKQGAVQLDGSRVSDTLPSFSLQPGVSLVLRCGKLHFRRLVVR
jgi:tyrosyl-tRNA synthetase